MRGNAPIALGTIVFGAALMIISTFLPLYEPTGYFRLIQENTLIQHGGWLLIVAALAIVGCGFLDSRKPNDWTLTFSVGCITAVGLVAVALYPDFRKLCSVGGLDGQVDSSNCHTAPFGIAMYVAFVGVGIALVGAFLLRGAETVAEDELVTAWASSRSTKKCPDCAETILADAKVCKHCGYRFTSEPEHITERTVN